VPPETLAQRVRGHERIELAGQLAVAPETEERIARPATRATTPGWMRALIARSDALNRRYGLGEYVRSPAGATTTAPGWLEGLLVRSDALNRKYGLGQYANGS
jgi:hypothetical protein